MKYVALLWLTACNSYPRVPFVVRCPGTSDTIVATNIVMQSDRLELQREDIEVASYARSCDARVLEALK